MHSRASNYIMLISSINVLGSTVLEKKLNSFERFQSSGSRWTVAVWLSVLGPQLTPGGCPNGPNTMFCSFRPFNLESWRLQLLKERKKKEAKQQAGVLFLFSVVLCVLDAFAVSCAFLWEFASFCGCLRPKLGQQRELVRSPRGCNVQD